jgi:predicted nucleic acid-binding protein
MTNASRPLVLDASVAVAWCFKEEASARTDAVTDLVLDRGAIVPSLWHLEVANVLIEAERRGRISAAQVAARFEQLSRLPIQIDGETAVRAFHDIAALARAKKLNVYDAAYLELAQRNGSALATCDANLTRAAQRIGFAIST